MTWNFVEVGTDIDKTSHSLRGYRPLNYWPNADFNGIDYLTEASDPMEIRFAQSPSHGSFINDLPLHLAHRYSGQDFEG